ncbi:unnamed protein product [Malassezia sympodialis ATCC 42132]|uniref:Similar to S.cerevisiae protein YJR107W (Putative lipase) n=1 Tax=Malassezia sympodialis (strain ATCC 42132) TaxID=1230383 RepID=M5E9Z7_MALS4|nr:uncharacterized protein MSY001_2279 [Malassezia sympodialis ATCC 42132]CCU99573.1 unnamed protein product [Malassezia sympodialis ATCC 42132]SHO78286.1 Similar to S.cerevisiae protein YJR107W (Putative lipase) [Malassezia sympodialis ATCC 42132]|eukprot:XP_018740814.1 uncharacterized protein MSY001_2279 [Malassezia sympodialis ATCC 42132]
MRFFGLAATLFSALAVVGASPARRANYGPTSYQKPEGLPVNWYELSLAAGLSSQTYCDDSDIYGLSVGEGTLLWSKWLGIVNQRVNVYHTPTLGVTVAFEGTTPSLLSILHDGELILEDPKGPLKDAVEGGAQIHSGFQDAYLSVAEETFKKVQSVMKEKNDTRVTTTGHSLGAAMGLLAAMDYNHRLEQGLHRSLVFGLPRVGNPEFADSVDKKIGGKFYYAVNGGDWVPHVPFREWNYQHPSGQIWIHPANSKNWKFYPGEENHFGANQVGIELTNMSDHHGWYFHTALGEHVVATCPATVNTHHY